MLYLAIEERKSRDHMVEEHDMICVTSLHTNPEIQNLNSVFPEIEPAWVMNLESNTQSRVLKNTCQRRIENSAMNDSENGLNERQ